MKSFHDTSNQVDRRAFMTSGTLALAGIGLTHPSDAPVQKSSMPPATDLVYNILNFGAVGDGRTPNTEAFASAITACSEAGGGTVFVPPGIFMSGPIYLKSNVTFHLESGAVVKGSPHLEDYPVEEAAESGESTRAGLISAFNAERVTLSGRGIIDGNALAFHDLNRLHTAGDLAKQYTRQGEAYMDPRYGTADGPLAHGERPGNLVRFIDCKHILLHGITVQNSPTWTVQFRRCENIDATGVHINSLESGRRIPNDDGMDLHTCRYVHIADCDIRTGDDSIAIFGGEAMTVTNCTLTSRSAGIRVGYRGENIRDCTFQNLVIQSNRGLLVNVRGTSSVENISFSDIVIRTGLVTGHWWGKAEPIHISIAPLSDQDTHLGHIKDIRFSNITAESESGIILYGTEEQFIQDLTFENIRINMKNGPHQASYGGNFDLRGARDIPRSLFAHDIPALYARFVDGLRIEGLRVAWEESLPEFFNHAIQLEDVRDVVISGFEGRQPHQSGSTIVLNRVGTISVVNSRALENTDVFLTHEGLSGARLFTNNDLIDARVPIQPAQSSFTLSGNVLPPSPE